MRFATAILLWTLLLAGMVVTGSLHGEEREIRHDVPYRSEGAAAAHANCRLDVYPAPGNDCPVMVWVHGGGWQIGNKSFVQQKPQAFNQRGWSFVSVGYRLHPEVDYAQQAADVANAIRWVHDHAREFGASPDKIFLMGHSAGAHLAALVATNEWFLEGAGLKLSNVKGVVLLDGAGYDIPRQVASARLPTMRSLYTNVFGTDGEVQAEASPITHVAADKDIPPFLILYVARREESRTQSEALAARLNECGSPSRAVPAQNKSHATINREIGIDGDEPTRVMFEFLEATAGGARDEGPGTSD